MHWNPIELTRIMYYPTLHFKGQEGQGGQGGQMGQGGQGEQGGRGERGGRGQRRGFGHALESIRIN